jgi:hypothetical protein
VAVADYLLKAGFVLRFPGPDFGVLPEHHGEVAGRSKEMEDIPLGREIFYPAVAKVGQPLSVS